MRNFLIYGHTPLADAIAWYLNSYASHRGLDVNVLQRDPFETVEIHEDVWANMVGPATPSRPDVVINCRVLAEAVSNTDAVASWAIHAQLPAKIALASRSAGIPFLHFTSDRVFKWKPRAKPEQAPKPIGVFGVTLHQGEKLIQRIYPPELNGESVRGSFVIRHSTLYGRGIENPVSQVLSNERKPGTVIASTIGESPTFLSEIAFLVARNLLESPQALMVDNGVIHVANPAEESISMRELITKAELGSMLISTVKEEPDAKQFDFGLTPSKGWGTARSWMKSHSDYMREHESDSYIRYW